MHHFRMFCEESGGQAVAGANYQKCSGGLGSGGMSCWNACIPIGFIRILGTRRWLVQTTRYNRNDESGWPQTGRHRQTNYMNVVLVVSKKQKTMDGRQNTFVVKND